MEIFFLGVVVGVILHQIYVKFVVWQTLREMKRNGIDFEDLFDQNLRSDRQDQVVKARLEQHGNLFLLYDAVTSEFIAQGNSATEIEGQVNQVRPNQAVIVIDSDPAVLARYRKTKPADA